MQSSGNIEENIRECLQKQEWSDGFQLELKPGLRAFFLETFKNLDVTCNVGARQLG